MSISTNNLILKTDSYKPSQWVQYPPGTTGVFSYGEARSGGKYPVTCVYGLQIFLKEFLSKPITQEYIDEAEALLTAHGEPFNRSGWEYILKEHAGYMPVKIRSVPEGTVIPINNVVYTIENTDPECYWLTSYLETALLRAVWYPTTVATVSWTIKQIILKYLEKTGDPESISFKLHDFGARGVSSGESAAIGGSAHLVNFMGTDTVESLLVPMKYYGAKTVSGFSIPASEHSTITSWGKDREFDAYRNMIEQFKDRPIFACVSDSYDIFNAAKNGWGGELKQEVLDSGAIVVVRPDSGDPVSVNVKLISILDQKFGSVKNEKGYYVLNNVRIIQGDGVNENSIKAILDAITEIGYSANNFAFGMGGALLQAMDRDTQKWAMKCSSMQIDGEWKDVYKQPITDPGKDSKRGRLTLVQDDYMNYRTVRESEIGDQVEILETVFENGKIIKEYTFDEIRANSNK